ncbi:MAG TPA: S9 family peptidase [Azospirillaceae bacterium]|nr:S9 family peptidase [Azospirillaceae bacterium]
MHLGWNGIRAGALALALAVPLAGPALAVERVERGNIVTEGVPELDKALAERLRAYLNVRSAGVVDWTADGKGLLITTRFGETAQLHRVDQPLGDRRQLTFLEEPITGAVASPKDADSVVYSWDVGGNEQWQFFGLDLKTGKSTLLTDGKSRNSGMLFSTKGDRLAFSSTRRNGTDTDVYATGLTDVATAKPLVAEKGSWSPIAWSQDDSKLLVLNYISANRSHLHVVDVATGQRTPLNPGKDTVSYSGVGFTPDGKGVFLLSDEAGEFKRLGLLDLASGQTRWFTADIPWDVEAAALTRDARTLAFVINEAGYSRLQLLDTTALTPLPAPNLPKGVIGGLAFSPDGKRLAISLSQPSAPADAWVYDLGARSLTQWTRSETGGLDPAGFADATLVQYPSFDKDNGKPRMIPAFVYRPRQAPKAGKLPVVVSIHGGPEAQSRPGFSSLAQFWANELGVAVILPNVRGSDGYGKTYLALDNGFKREDSVKDIGALIDWIGKQPDLDGGRVAVAGGSYGGYMTLASMTHYNDRLAGGASSVGISNFITFLESTSAYRRDLRRVEYGDERDPAMREHLQKISPLTNAARITKPMLIIQGANDPRVPLGESEQIVAAIRKNGGDVWYVLAKDEGHGFKKKSNQFYGNMAQALFFRKILGLSSAS